MNDYSGIEHMLNLCFLMMMTGVTPMSLDDSGESKEELTLKNAVVPAANEDCSDTYTKKPAF